MAECHECGTDTGMPYTCPSCGAKLCSDHRLPENHSCYEPREEIVVSPGSESSSILGLLATPVYLVLAGVVWASVAVSKLLRVSRVRPRWQCSSCGSEYRRAPRECSDCGHTVYDKL